MYFHRLPEYLNYEQESAKRLTRVLATLDAEVVCGWNRQTQRYEIWGPSKSEGWCFLAAVEKPDGGYCSPEMYPMYVLAELRSRARPVDTRAMLERNAAQAERTWHAEMDQLGEQAKYVAKAVAQESIGALRYGTNDVFIGLNAALDNRKAPKVGQKIYIPGVW